MFFSTGTLTVQYHLRLPYLYVINRMTMGDCLLSLITMGLYYLTVTLSKMVTCTQITSTDNKPYIV